MMDRLPEDIEMALRKVGLLCSPDVTAMAGGVSCDIWRVEEGGKAIVVKRALSSLRVAEEWRADPARNQHERKYLAWVGRYFPDIVPMVLFATDSFFAMEFLDGFTDWKTELMTGRCDRNSAARGGVILAKIHAESWNNPETAEKFNHPQFFEELRIAPYLRSAAAKNPALADRILREAERLSITRIALVHGDFSPKNLMIGHGRMVVLDCEVACQGDPAFDVAFLLNHLLLKSLHLHDCRDMLLELALEFSDAYARTIGSERFALVCKNTPTLLLCLLLARVDGKSPVEYLDADSRNFVRSFVTTHLPDPPVFPEPFMKIWSQSLPI